MLGFVLVKCTLSNFLLFCASEVKEEEPTYVTVTVDTTHTVSDHYSVGKKLGVYVWDLIDWVSL